MSRIYVPFIMMGWHDGLPEDDMKLSYRYISRSASRLERNIMLSKIAPTGRQFKVQMIQNGLCLSVRQAPHYIQKHSALRSGR
jgi:hypothetical protein